MWHYNLIIILCCQDPCTVLSGMQVPIPFKRKTVAGTGFQMRSNLFFKNLFAALVEMLAFQLFSSFAMLPSCPARCPHCRVAVCRLQSLTPQTDDRASEVVSIWVHQPQPLYLQGSDALAPLTAPAYLLTREFLSQL